MRRSCSAAGAVAALLIGSTARATTYEITPSDDLFGTLQNLTAGDEVIVHAGVYPTPGFFELILLGSETQPIVVRGADGELPVLQGDPTQNVLNLTGSYFTLKNLEIVGGSHGIRLGNANHGTLEGLVLHGLGDVGISCNRDGEYCDGMILRHNEIYDTGLTDTGEGMYLGCNDAACSFTNSIVENNYIHDLGGSQGDGIEIKSGSYGNIVRDNVIVRSNYPGITMYGYSGPGAANVVERNLVWHTNDNGIQVVGQVVVRNNIVLDAGANGIHSKASQGHLPDGAVILHNTVVGAGTACLKTNDWSLAAGQVAANNALYCEGGTAVDLNGGAPMAVVTGNVALGASNAPAGVTPGTSESADLGDPDAAAVYPPAGSALIDAADADAAQVVADDFNGLPREGPPDVGAYERSTDGNPGWPPGEGFKDEVPTGGAGGGGEGGGSGAVGGAGSGGDPGPAGPGVGGGSTSGVGASASDADAEDDAGCGCRTPRARDVGRGRLAAILAAGFLLVVRRARRARLTPKTAQS